VAVDGPLGPGVQLVVGMAKPLALDVVEERLGYRFQDRELLRRALTHASALDNDGDHRQTYQRLEFVGDRVLGLTIAEMLFAAFPDAAEGELARRLNHLVRQETCAAVALEADLGKAMLIGEGEAQSGGRKKRPLLADVCEAVIAALYLDGGFDVARRFIEKHWRERLHSKDAPRRDAKTMLQEWAQGRGLEPPTYAIADRSGPDHEPVFLVEVSVAGFEGMTAKGRSRRQGEQAAAAAFLVREGVWSENEND